MYRSSYRAGFVAKCREASATLLKELTFSTLSLLSGWVGPAVALSLELAGPLPFGPESTLSLGA